MKRAILAVVPLLLLVAGAYGFWLWFFCRFYVEPGEMAILTAKSGRPLEPGQQLAEPGQKGIQAAPLGEGRHFRNPILFSWKIQPAILIPPGKVGVVTAKIGLDLPEGAFIAERGQKGIWRGVIGPGRYRFNPVGYNVEIVDATSIPIGYVGVVTGLSGDQPAEGTFARAGQKGVRQDILQPGLYYVNPKELQVDVLEIGLNQVSLQGKTGGEIITKAPLAAQNAAIDKLTQRALHEQQQKRIEYMDEQRASAPSRSSYGDYSSAETTRAAPSAVPGRPPAPTRTTGGEAVLSLNQFVEFPSRDGFDISLDLTVEFELLPGRIAWIYQAYGDLPAVVDKIIMPQILSVSRLKGSAYRAKDFIVGEGREKFQTDLTETLARTLEAKQIIIHNALIRHVNVPDQILAPIQEASVAVEQDLTNKEKQNTARKQADLNTQTALIEQNREQVAQETEKLRATIKADQEREVANLRATAMKDVADIERQTAEVHAGKARTQGEASAKVVQLVEGEKANGFTLKTGAFKDPSAYTLWELAQSLNPDVKINILPTGPGTLWTDLENARLGDLGGAKQMKQP